jgi:hypothetical protein
MRERAGKIVDAAVALGLGDDADDLLGARLARVQAALERRQIVGAAIGT